MRVVGTILRSLLGRAPAAGASAAAPSGAGDTPTRTVVVQGFRIDLDLTRQVLALEVPEDFDFAVDESGEAPLAATLAQLDLTGPVSAALLAQKAKIFDDGLYAAVEVAAQEGAGRHAGKAALLASLARALAGSGPDMAGDAGAVLLAAARMGEVPLPDLPASVEARVQGAVQAFLADERRSKPLGFYTWSGRLASIFQQDRQLQESLPPERPDSPGGCAGLRALVRALHGDPASRATYERHLQLVSRLTNPFSRPDLRHLLEALDRGEAAEAQEGTAFLPPSVSHENRIAAQLYGGKPVPEDFVLMDAMIGAIRSGALDLTPRPESGWYDHQTWALEPLVVPERTAEAAHLALDVEYRKLLLELFKGLLTLTRETHVKQLDMTLGCPAYLREKALDISPDLAAEPLATYYLRRALAYRFVRAALEDAFGPEALERMRRLTPEGPGSASLDEELADVERLFVGAHVTVARQLGMAPDAAAGDARSMKEAAARFQSWSRDRNRDPDVSRDVRCMVPVFYDQQRRQAKVWVFLGWSERWVVARFQRTPVPTVLTRSGKPARAHPPIRWGSQLLRLAYPVVAEVWVDRVLNRAEFRQLCDVGRTREEIMRRLGVAEPLPPRPGPELEALLSDPSCVCLQCGWRPRLAPRGTRPERCLRCGGPLSGSS